jgi:hypothetical protein
VNSSARAALSGHVVGVAFVGSERLSNKAGDAGSANPRFMNFGAALFRPS